MTQEEKHIEIENIASLLFSKEEIALITGVPEEELSTIYSNSIQKGRLTREAKLRQSILSLAENGSSPAQALAVEFLNVLKRDQV